MEVGNSIADVLFRLLKRRKTKTSGLKQKQKILSAEGRRQWASRDAPE